MYLVNNIPKNCSVVTIICFFFLWLFGPFPGHRLPCFPHPVTPICGCCMPIFGVDQFAGMLPHLTSCLFLQLYGRPSSLKTSSQNSLWDSVVEHAYYIPNPLQSFNMHVRYKVSIYTISIVPNCTILFRCHYIYWCKNYPGDFSVTRTNHLCSTLTNCPCFTPIQNSWSVHLFAHLTSLF